MKSLQVTYSDSPVSALCRACLENLVFKVTIWNNDNHLLVEVDRVSGDSMVLHSKYAKLILETVTGRYSNDTNRGTNSALQSQDPINQKYSENARMQLKVTDSLLQQCEAHSYYFGKAPWHLRSRLWKVELSLIYMKREDKA
jgi:hypothetical protein